MDNSLKLQKGFALYNENTNTLGVVIDNVIPKIKKLPEMLKIIWYKNDNFFIGYTPLSDVDKFKHLYYIVEDDDVELFIDVEKKMREHPNPDYYSTPLFEVFKEMVIERFKYIEKNLRSTNYIS